MVLASIKPSRIGYEMRTFRGDDCDDIDKAVTATCSMKWMSSGLRAALGFFGRLFWRVQASGPRSPGFEPGPLERREGGPRHSTTADHILFATAVQFCSLS